MLRLMRRLPKRSWGLICTALCFIVIQVWLDLKLPDYMSSITILVQTEGSEMEEILSAGLRMLGCAAGSLACSITVSLLSAIMAASFAAQLRAEQFNKVQEFSMGEIGHFSTASLITRTTNDVQQVLTLIVMGLQVIVKAPIMATWAIMKIYSKGIEWTMATGVAVAILLVFVIICVTLVLPKFRSLQGYTDDVNRVMRENLNGLSVVRAYNAEAYQEAKFDDANNNLTSANLYANRVMALLSPIVQSVMSGLSLAIYWIGAVLIQSAGMANKLTLFSDMVVFSSYAVQVIMSFMLLVIIFIIGPRAMVAAERIMQVLDTKPSIHDGTAHSGLDGVSGLVEMRGVSFHYPDGENDVIRDITFTASPGETVAFIGATGSGKSTVINLIPRFYDVDAGEVLVDGRNVREWNQEALRNRIGYVSQQAVLFSGDIMSNVAYGTLGEVDEHLVREAIDIAQATEFVERQEGELHGFVAQGGSNFSGGQKQRLSIARAIALHPEILIFDDSFSALDYRTDHALRKALAAHCSNTTKIIVAQRIGTIRDADRIIVLDEGRIVGMGTHEELMAQCDVYQQIARSQLSEEELA